MRRLVTPLILSCICLMLPLFMIPAVAYGQSEQLVISEDSALGHVTIENNNLRAVWHFKAVGHDSYNQSGGNLYELYFKATDPGTSLNLVSYPDIPGWGNGRSTPIWSGVGGIGSTVMYAVETQPESSQNSNYADLIADNNLSGILESRTSTIDGSGNAVLTFVFRVKNQSTNQQWYRVAKTWTVEPDGTIRYRIDWTTLKSGYYSEIATRSKWSYEAGWNRFAKYGKDWLPSSSTKYLLGFYGIDEETAQCWDSLNAFHPDWITLAGSSFAPQLSMIADNNGQGFAGSGSYQLGTELFGSVASPTLEQCSIQSGEGIGSHSMNWMAWWGGSPPTGSRYRWIDAGRSWSDSYLIETAAPADAGPDITSVTSTAGIASGTTITWDTDRASDSVVQIRNGSGAWVTAGQDYAPVTHHSIELTGLSAGGTYQYQVTSRDSAGRLAVSRGYSLEMVASPAITLQVQLEDSYWANYRDYLSRDLTTAFLLGNSSQTIAYGVSISSSSSSSGVNASNLFPIAVGNIIPGELKRFEVKYSVPADVSRFSATISGYGTASDGTVFYFPN